MSVILGIDPGSRILGYAVLTSGSTLKVQCCDVLRMADMDDHSDRLQFIFEELTRIIQTYKPDNCAIETPVYGKDPLAMLKLGRAQAACILAMTTNKIPVTEYYPKVVKKSITGRGNASKDQVAFMLDKMMHLDKKRLPKDATDALAVAWCHMVKGDSQASGIPDSKRRLHQNNKSSSWSEFVKNNPERIREL